MSNQAYVAILTVVLLVAALLLVRFFAYKAYEINEKHRGDQQEIRRMFFAAAVLTGLFALMGESMFMYYFSNDSSEGGNAGKDIFDACKTILPPLIALVIGYFFGKNDSSRNKASNDDDSQK